MLNLQNEGRRISKNEGVGDRSPEEETSYIRSVLRTLKTHPRLEYRTSKHSSLSKG